MRFQEPGSRGPAVSLTWSAEVRDSLARVDVGLGDNVQTGIYRLASDMV